MTTEEIIAGCIKKDLHCQRVLYETYAPKMLGLCRRYVNDIESAEDILQDGFIKIFTKIDTYEGIGCFSGWIKKVFITTALEHIRKNNIMKFSISIDEISNIKSDSDNLILSALTMNDLMTCISSLPIGYRTVFNLYAIEGYSHQEISDMLNISISTSQTQLLRARKVLQKTVTSLIGQDHASRRVK